MTDAAIVGPTASGKSALGMALAVEDGGWEIVSVDSMQVYRGMDIGTAKPTSSQRTVVRHHLVDVADVDEPFDVSTFQTLVAAARTEIAGRGNRALLVGGTGLYLRAVVDDLNVPGRFPDVRRELEAEPDTEALHRRLDRLDPTAAARMEPTNRRRVLRALEVTIGAGRPFSDFGPGLDHHPPSDVRMIGLAVERQVLDRRIETRIEAQLAAGWLDEVRSLRATGWSRTASQALGYRELAAHLDGDRSLRDAIAEIVVRTRRFARRQERWFRRDPRIAWVEVGEEPLAALDRVRRLLAGPPD